MKKIFLISVGVLGLAVLAYFGYHFWVNSKFSAWRYIPESALVVIESNSLQLPEKDSTQLLKYGAIPLCEQAQKSVESLQNIIADSLLAQKFLAQKNIIYSLHTETKNRLSFITYVPYNPAKDSKPIDAIVNPTISSGIRPFSHTFDGFKITELYKGTSKEPLIAYITHDNYLIFSKSGLLMEDVVRKINELAASNVRGALADETKDSKGFFTRLFVNERPVLALGEIIFGKESLLSQLFLPLVSKQSNYQVGFSKKRDSFLLVSNSKSEDAYPIFSMLEQQKPLPIRHLELIPNNTAVLTHLSVSNAAALGQNAGSYLSKHENAWFEQRRDADETYLLNLDSVYHYLKDEVLYCRMETDGVEQSGHLLILPSANATQFFNFLNLEAGKIKLVTRSPQIRENYLNSPIRELALPLPSFLFGNLMSGFKKSFFAVYGTAVLVADDPQVLKNALTDLSINNVWANNNRQQAYVKSLSPSQLSILVNPDKSWSRMIQGVSDRWLGSIESLENQIRGLGYVTLQGGIKAGNAKLSIQLSQGQPATADAFLNKSFLQKQIPIGKSLLRAPFLYKNSATRLYEVMLQTADNQLTFLQADGKVLAKYPLNKPIVSDIQAIDYLKNGRTQFIFALSDQLMVFDRNDSLVAFYPSQAFQADLSHFSIFYDEATKRQKLIVSDLKGLYYTYNKTDKSLKPLNYIKDISHTVVPVQSVTLGGIDYDILLQENGKLHISNALGAEIKNSPFDLQAKFNSPVYIESSAQYSSYVFHAVSRQGEVITVNLKGEVLNRQQLMRPSKDSDFQLLPEQNNNDWLITCTTGQTMSVFNKRGELLFQFQNLPPNAFELRFHSFGSDIKFLSLRTGKQTKIYDLTGQQVGDKAIESEFPVALAYSESYNKLFIYASNKNNLDIWTVKVR